MPVDVLIFGAHPDDVEWGVGGIALLLQRKGVSFALVDFTRGEMGSRGTPSEREMEAQRAAEFLGGVPRLDLGMPDSGIVDTPEARMQVARVIRQYRPSLLLSPYWQDRHPDHAAAGLLVKNAGVYSILTKLQNADAPHKPAATIHYLLHAFVKPSIVVDVTDVYSEKQALLRLHESQFAKTAEEFGVVPHGLGDYLFALESRDRYFGSLIGVRHGEALVIDEPLALRDISPLLALTR